MKIVIGIDGSGAGEALQKLREYQRWLEERTQELVKKLAERGKEVAQISFGNAAYDGINDVIVEVENRGENVCAVVATGNAALFIEFGAGVWNAEQHPEPLDFERGTYGKGQGANDYWFYTGQPATAGGELAYGHPNTTITHGNPPSASMYNAMKQIEQEIYQIAQEVFSH